MSRLYNFHSDLNYIEKNTKNQNMITDCRSSLRGPSEPQGIDSASIWGRQKNLELHIHNASIIMNVYCM